MCQSSLFYFGLNITEYGYPTSTCFEPIKQYLVDYGKPYAKIASVIAFMNLTMFLLTFGLYKYKEFCCCKKKDYKSHLIQY